MKVAMFPYIVGIFLRQQATAISFFCSRVGISTTILLLDVHCVAGVVVFLTMILHESFFVYLAPSSKTVPLFRK